MRVLAIDDEEVNIGAIEANLTRYNYEVLTASDGQQGLDIVLQNPKEIDIILLDRMMPNMDGMEFLSKIKASEFTKDIPVIMQTAAATTEQIVQGIEAGVFYYLTKPFDARTLLSIVNSAAREVQHVNEMEFDIEQKLVVYDIMHESYFRIQTREQARRLGIYIGKLCTHSHQTGVGYGISELLLNGIEHGNLGIGYNLKGDLLKESDDAFRDEVNNRLALPENKDKYVELHYSKNDDEIRITIKDQGEGFDTKADVSFDAHRMHEPNGRGVARAKILCDEMFYNDKGNEVTMVIYNQEKSE